MEVTFLLGGIFSPIASILGLIMNAIFEFFNLFGIQNIALSIFVFTFIVKMLMLPLTIKQQKTSRMTSRMNPEIQAIQAKYKGKRDEASMRKMKAETDAVYQKYGTNPASGCLPMLIMLPIMFALYEVINNIPDHVNLVRESYETVAQAVLNNNGLIAEVADKVGKVMNITAETLTTESKVMEALAKFTFDNWNELMTKLSGDAVAAVQNIKNVNNFFGLSITNNPSLKSITVIIPVLAMSLQFIQSKQLQVKTEKKNADPTASAMNSMSVVMPIMSGFFCLMLPIGVGLYWIANSLFSIVQQFIVNKQLDKINIDELVEKTAEKQSKKYAVKNSSGVSLAEVAKKQTKTIESSATQIDTHDNEAEAQDVSDKKVSSQPTSITEIANLLKNRNEKGDK